MCRESWLLHVHVENDLLKEGSEVCKSKSALLPTVYCV